MFNKRKLLIFISVLVFCITFFGILKIFPRCYYRYRFQVENYTLYSNQPVDSSVIQVIGTVNMLTGNKRFNFPNYRYDIFLSNSYFLFWIHTALNKMATGASDLVTNNIYIANADIEKNSACNFQEGRERSLHSVIAHESTHILLRKKYGLRKYRKLLKHKNWKVEGFCEWIALNDVPPDEEKIRKIVQSESYITNPFDRYITYRAAVSYLLEDESCDLDRLMASDDNFETILQECVIQQ